MQQEKVDNTWLKKNGNLGVIIGSTWIGLHIIVPLTLLRIPIVQKYLVVLENNIPFNIPGIG